MSLRALCATHVQYFVLVLSARAFALLCCTVFSLPFQHRQRGVGQLRAHHEAVG